MSEERASAHPPQAGRSWSVPVAVVATLLVVAVGHLLGNSGASAAENDEPAADPAQLGMVVSGTGSAVGVPDQLRFNVTVQHRESDVTAAIDATSADVRKVIRALTERGIARKDIRTANVSVQPTYRYANGQEQITGFSASERISITVRVLKTAGSVISATANAGGNAVRIGGIAMSVADPSTLLAQARANAVADARTKAEQFAKAAGRELGEVVVVEEATELAPYEMQRAAVDSLAATAGKVPIVPGTDTTKVHVRVRWSFA